MGQLSEHQGRYGQETHTSLDATEASSFDDLAKGMASGNLSRRKALRMLGAALVGGALASMPGVAWAAPCRSPRIRCAGQCCAEGVTACQGTGRNKTCGPPVGCPTGQEVCGGQCVDTSTDVANCGGCGNACRATAICVGGQCVCPPGTEPLSNGYCCDPFRGCSTTCCPEGYGCVEPGSGYPEARCVPVCTGATNCCCSCDYRNSQTGAAVYHGACDAATTMSREQCQAYCETNAPPGYDETLAAYGCSGEDVGYPYNLICFSGCTADECLPPPEA